MNSALSPSLGKLLLRAFVLLVGLWWVTEARPAAAATTCWSENNECDRTQGENCANCPQDCECTCGDDVCSTAWPDNETCNNCPQDCWASCVCGDSICSYPEAEGAGHGNGECDTEQNPHCGCCMIDCGPCSSLLCYLDEDKACDDSCGCGPCDGDEMNPGMHECTPGTCCQEDGTCIFCM